MFGDEEVWMVEARGEKCVKLIVLFWVKWNLSYISCLQIILSISGKLKRVSVVIVNYNGKHFLKDCLESLRNQSFCDFETIVVDNGSKDGSAEYMRGEYPWVKVVELKENLGFAGGNNEGVRVSEGELIVLLNNDTIAEEDWLKGLVEAVEPKECAAASSLILTDGIPQKYYEKNGSLNLFGHNIMRIFNVPENIFYCGGASLIYKKAVLGIPFDEDFFAYSEDVYLSLRARFMGYEVKHTNASVLRHLGGGTFRKEKNETLTYFQERNRLLNYLLFFSGKTLIKMSPYFLLNFLIKTAGSLLPNKYSLTGTLRAYKYLLTSVKEIKKKREILQREFKVPEEEVIKWMTCKIFNEETRHARVINKISEFYCRIVNLRSVEIAGEIR